MRSSAPTMPSELITEEVFDARDLIRPTDRQPNFVHLVRALATMAGVRPAEIGLDPEIVQYPPVRQLLEILSESSPRHLVFVLLDGVGMNLLRRLPATSFLRSNLRLQLYAACPSTTACALTSLATGHYPNRHGVTGWFTALPEYELTAQLLPFTDRLTGQPLTDRDIRPEHVLPSPSILPLMRTHRPVTVVPAKLTNTAYNTWWRGGTEGRGYGTIHQAMETVADRIRSTGEPTYTHLYLPEVDTLCHKLGTEHAAVWKLTSDIDAELERLAEKLREIGGTRLVVCADHGLVDVPRERQTLLLAGDPMLELLRFPPSGDARLPIFHVRSETRQAFVEHFQERFGRDMLLADLAAIEALELLGPGRLSEVARVRFGDFLALIRGRETLAYHPPTKPLSPPYLGVHGGLSFEEMLVPLCVA